MIVRSKAPLRIGFAGGGSDVSPFSDLHGGAILNATLNMYAYATIIPRNDGKIVLNSIDKGIYLEMDSKMELETEGDLDLIKGIYNRIAKDFCDAPLSFELSTHVDAPPGSGLGSSSTLVVTILGAFREWLNLPLGEYDMAHLAYQIEREDMNMAGGKQDQYAATFGGINFMEFFKDDKVIVNPLRIKTEVLDELAYNLILLNTNTSRLSSQIILAQQENVKNNLKSSVEAMHRIKEQALLMKEVLLKGELDRMGEILNLGWEYKQKMADNIVTDEIQDLYNKAMKAGASGGKISGAGGGGFMLFYCPNNSRYSVIRELNNSTVNIHRFEFTNTGLRSWQTD
ncbi:MAG: dehydrogenase [Bacteroidales bacterium]|jgi:D-glycero-alpha-D-manno-heptose-7-phosphate kinase|nr:dehydrogenase [Bacteroidales bacterium]